MSNKTIKITYMSSAKETWYELSDHNDFAFHSGVRSIYTTPDWYPWTPMMELLLLKSGYEYETKN